MSSMPPPALPPEGPGFSSLVPLLSRRTRPFWSRILIPLAILMMTSIALFGMLGNIKTVGDFQTYLNIMGIALLGGLFYLVYLYSGETSPSFRYWVAAAIVYVEIKYLYSEVMSPILQPIGALVGMAKDGTDSFWRALVHHFAMAGFPEELWKAAPMLACLAISLLGSRSDSGPQGWVRLQGPLDGLVMGVAVGLAFTLIETNDRYAMRVLQSGQGAGAPFQAMLLVIPRYLDNFGLHAGCSAIFGYFIGLAATHRRHAGQLVLTGWLVSSMLHALWNAFYVSYGPWLTAPIGLFTSFLFLACLLKARQLEAPRLLADGGGGSVLVSPPPPIAAGIVPPPVPGASGALSRFVSAIEQGIGVAARTTNPTPGKAGLALGTSKVRYALTPGLAIDLQALFEGLPPGTSARTETLPDGHLALRNTGASAWGIIRPSGMSESVPTGEIVAPELGMRIVIGGMELAVTSHSWTSSTG